MTDVDRRSAGRLMASTALFKNLIFIKCFGFSAGTSLLSYEKELWKGGGGRKHLPPGLARELKAQG